MTDLLPMAANDLLKREPTRLVAATGLFFRELSQAASRTALGQVLVSSRGGVWGDAAAPGQAMPLWLLVSWAEPFWASI